MDKKEIYTRSLLKAAGITLDENVIKEKKISWWYNLRQKNQGGLRLTEKGLNFLIDEAQIKIYVIDFPNKMILTSQILIWLDNFINSPYFLSQKKIIVTEEKIAFELYLFSGDIKKLGYNKSMSKRLNQI